MLVLSLMLSDVDGKTYEYGMLRSLGYRKPHLVSMITMQSSMFSIPGMVFGIIVAFIINIGLR
jgi:ABC-type antimicrobial peptide transport system permease subunit